MPASFGMRGKNRSASSSLSLSSLMEPQVIEPTIDTIDAIDGIDPSLSSSSSSPSSSSTVAEVEMARRQRRERARAFSALEWVEVVALVRRQMRSFVGPSRDLEDLTQATLEKICKNLDRFEGRAEFATYTYRACSRVAINHWRWYKRWLRSFERATESTPEPPAEGTDAAERLIERERLTRLERALEKLSANKRAVLTLCELEEMPATRVAEILGCPEATVRSRLSRARADLAKILKSESESDPES
jgi:RNA polymerase sigma-70 factor, ECF subfamily